jgi:hypothetical protein
MSGTAKLMLNLIYIIQTPFIFIMGRNIVEDLNLFIRTNAKRARTAQIN